MRIIMNIAVFVLTFDILIHISDILRVELPVEVRITSYVYSTLILLSKVVGLVAMLVLLIKGGF